MLLQNKREKREREKGKREKERRREREGESEMSLSKRLDLAGGNLVVIVQLPRPLLVNKTEHKGQQAAHGTGGGGRTGGFECWPPLVLGAIKGILAKLSVH